jgi:riboflavin kinase/FMN adenylyltransferase
LKNYSISKNKNEITSIAIGGFDGMHLAHQELFKRLDKNGAIVVIQTGYANLTPKTTRAKYTSFPIYFYELQLIKHLSAKDFINLIKQEFVNLKTIVVGFDFRFGINASGSIHTLKELFDGEVIVVDEFKYKGIAVHSRVIRDLISTGQIKKANQLLGKNYTITGMHIKGQGLGAKQFVPTINIDVKEFMYPSAGIYVTYTYINDIKYQSVTFIGHRVTTDGKFAIETHILNKDIKDEDINSKISIEFLSKLRENKKFELYENLKKQILLDIKQSKDYFIKNNN